MKKLYAITISIAIILISSIIFQYLKIYFASLEPTGASIFILESIKIIPLIIGVLLIKYSWKKILNSSND